MQAAPPRAGSSRPARGSPRGVSFDTARTGPALAGRADAAAGPGRDYAGLDDDQLIGVLVAWQKTEAWAAAGRLSAVAELICRRPAETGVTRGSAGNRARPRPGDHASPPPANGSPRPAGSPSVASSPGASTSDSGGTSPGAASASAASSPGASGPSSPGGSSSGAASAAAASPAAASPGPARPVPGRPGPARVRAGWGLRAGSAGRACGRSRPPPGGSPLMSWRWRWRARGGRRSGC